MSSKQSSADAFLAAQATCHDSLYALLAGVPLTNLERLLTLALRGEQVSRRYAGPLAKAHRELFLSKPPHALGATVAVQPEPYLGSDATVLRLAEYLEQHLAADLVGAYVHGSLATEEAVAYSDFDALLVLRDESVADADRLTHVCHRVLKGLRFLVARDPLQHHGFFVLTETDLEFYRQPFFPSELWAGTRSLLPKQNPRLTLNLVARPGDAAEAFATMVRSIRKRTTTGRLPANYFELKRLLSQLMLLPALYLQAGGQEVSKRDSFSIAAGDFSPGTWRTMEVASRIREEWDYAPTMLTKLLQSIGPTASVVTECEKALGRRLSPAMRQALANGFYEGVEELITAMQERLQGTRPR